MSTNHIAKERNYYFDNARFILIFLVVLGHLLEAFLGSHKLKTIFLWIYVFHMPAFVFISGYFSKNYDTDRFRKKTFNLFILYLIFQISYHTYYFLTIKSTLNFVMFTPYWILWYLFSLVTWRIALPYAVKIRYLFIVALFISFISGYIIDAHYDFSIMRTMTFFPFFIAGYFFKEKFLKIKEHLLVKIGAVIFLVFLLILCYTKPFFYEPKWLFGSVNYYKLTSSNIHAGIYKIILLTLQFAGLSSLLILIPSKKNITTKLGTKTLYVFLLHGFIVQGLIASDVFGKYFEPLWTKFLLFPMALLIVIALSSKAVTRLFKVILETDYISLRLPDLKKMLNYIIKHKYFLLLVLLMFIIDFIYLGIYNYKTSPDISKKILLSIYLWKAIYDCALCFSISFFLYVITKRSIFPLIFIAFYTFVIIMDAGLYFFSNTIFMKEYISYFTWYSIKSFFSMQFFSLLLLLSVAIGLYIFFFNKYKEKITLTKATVLLPIVVALMLYNLPAFAFRAILNTKGKTEYLERILLEEKRDQAIYATRNSLINVVTELLTPRTGQITKVNNYDAYKDIIKKYNLRPGKKTYKDLNLKDFKKVVLITVESLSLGFLSDYNTQIGVSTSPFLGSKAIKEQMFVNYYTTGRPTLTGLTVIHHSHPIYNLFVKGNNKYALPNILKDNGFNTVFLRSSSKYYASENIIFDRFGFDRMYAREEFEMNRKNSKYIYVWGACDRLVYDKIIDLLKEYKDSKLFINVLGADTHPLEGRIDYKDLEYPPLPPEIDNPKSFKANYLKAVYYKDFDLKRLLDRLQQENLYTDDTLLIVTADHACIDGMLVKEIPGLKNFPNARIPLLFLTPQTLPDVDKTQLSSQVDLAPTILHLLDIPIPTGYWGDSLFSDKKTEQAIEVKKNTIIINNKNKRHFFNINGDKKDEQELKALMHALQK